MGHEHHFLSRLDRVSLPHVELALALYRDHSLLKYLLQQVKLPDAAERVAISLDHPQDGPFLVITREGRFVTCLGTGMKAANLPVVTRGQLDALTAKVGELRTRIQEALAFARSRGGAEKLLERLYTGGPALSREEFVGIAAFQPLMGPRLLTSYFRAVTRLEHMRERVLKIERPRPDSTSLLRAYWDTFWTVAHLAVLAFVDGRAMIEDLPKELDLGRHALSWGAVRQGIIGPALRGIWAVAKVGKAQLKTCKDSFDAARTPLGLVTGATGLIALGVRHAKLRAEIAKAIEAPRDDSNAYFKPSLLHTLQAAAKVAFDKPDEATQIPRKLGAEIAVAFGRGLPPGAALRFEREEDVPEDLAMTLVTNLQAPFLGEPDGVLVLALCLPWVARAEPEQLFLPRDLSRVAHGRWTPADTIRLAQPLREHYRAPPPARPEGPTRNGPCPCGSGKKYKRCCGAER